MVGLLPSPKRFSASLTRRDWLRAGAVAAGGLCLPQLLQAERGTQDRGKATAKRCIYIFLCGGPSQLDMWDPKPHALEEIRGPFAPLATNVPGIQFTELLPRTAKHADKLAIVRSLHHGSASHDTGIMYTLLGTSSPPNNRSFPPSRQDHPGIGAALQAVLGSPGELPAWVVAPRVFTTGSLFFKGQTGGFLGPAFDPFALDEPKKNSLEEKEFALQSMSPMEGVDAARFNSRKSLLGNLEAFTDAQLAAAAIDETTKYREKAYSMLSSDGAKRAFDLKREPAKLRDRYGRNEYGQSFLLARRLVESGVRMVNVFWTFYGKDGCQFNLWDNHGIDGPVCGGYSKGVDMIRAPYCCPSFDLAFSALLEDLKQRGMLDDTLVVVIGEFGRTPKINKTAGRDHWPNCYSAVLAGGGVKGGQVYGRSDKHAAYVADNPVTPDDFTATIYHAFGLPPGTPVHDPENRPIPISKGRPITAIF